MSVRIYRLLRNNKEEGPLTAEELINKQLRAYDLIWIDGRSAVWSYPGELPEFKKYAPLLAEEIAETKNSKQQAAAVSLSVQAAMAMNNNIISVAPQKPRYKVSAAWTKIQTTPSPALSNNNPNKIKEPMVKASSPNQGSLVQSKSLSWEEAWLDWEKERGSNEPALGSLIEKKVNARSKKIVANDTQPLEVNYAESPDSLKGNYIDNPVQQQSGSKKSPAQNNVSEFILPAAALIIIFSIGFWLLHNTNYTEKPVTPIVRQPQPAVHSNSNTADNKSQIQKAVSNLTAKQDDKSSGNSFDDDEKATDRNPGFSSTKIPVQHNEAGTQQNSSSQLSAPTDTQQSINKSTNKTSPDNNANTSTGSNPSSKITDTINNVSINNPGSNTSMLNNVLPANNNAKTTDDYVSVPSYIAMNNGTGTIKIQNVSDINLDLVVVNVQYFTASGTFHKGETLCLHNLRAGKNVIIKTPKDDTSAYAVSNVSLVSADAEKVYIVGDN